MVPGVAVRLYYVTIRICLRLSDQLYVTACLQGPEQLGSESPCLSMERFLTHRPQKREAGLSKPPPGMGSMGRVLMGFTPVGVPQKSAEASANRGLQAGGPRWRRTSLTSRGQESEAEPGPPTTHKSPKPGLGRGDLLTPATTTKYS